ncbi:LysM peptidoglycan-binding domain-containing protein [Lentimicrobium sp. L6]|uniref:LysM peptidoglycan-binding domain-containing protein n=1 Tax=Lentimicrobium sp. L6 TaxID=2735916 RepID=UPI001556F0CD|nr:LysM peptidoglycan-binding domain-containing protein [Lentimicrobium sp. L6]NPD84803.1 LysM peptidoglycan-binding domain-containing protein [Lentimicrobium sp. L6]
MNMKYPVFLTLLLSLCINFTAVSQDYSAQKSEETMSEDGKKFYIHHVVKGNTLYNISKTYGVATNVILKNNPLLNDGLRMGLELRIPVQAKTATIDFIYHIVKKKETLYHISKIYNVTIADIKTLNEIEGEEISPGQYLKIPSMFVQSNESSLHTEAQEAKTAKIDDDKYSIYKVQPKETLFTISKRFGISVDALMYINDLTDSNIQEGQDLLIPKKLTQPQKQSTIDSARFIQHKVKPQETLFGLARQYAIPVAEIEKNNELGDRQIQIGQTLLIPRKLNETGYIKHKVAERKEKLTQIAVSYDVTVADLKMANPNVSSKLKRGESLLIPLDFIETDFETEELEDIVVSGEEIVDDIPDVIEDSLCSKIGEQDKRYKVVLMLPLYLNEIDSLIFVDTMVLMDRRYDKPFKFIEFYEGALLAARELNESGLEFDLHVMDIPRETEGTRAALNSTDLSDVDLIISLLYSSSFEVVSEYSNRHQIPLVNVLSKRRKVIYDNPNVFKIEPDEDALIEQVGNYIVDRYQNHNIILVRSNPYQLANEYKELKQILEEGIPNQMGIPNADILYKVSQYELDYPETEIDYSILATKEIRKVMPGFDYELTQSYPNDTTLLPNSLKTVVYSVDSLYGISEASSLIRNNLVVAFGTEEVFAIELFTKLNFVRDSFDYQVIGLPHWSDYTEIDVAYTQPLGLQVASAKYIDYSKPEVQDFVLSFRDEFGIEPQKNRHAFLGYDVTKYFLTALANYGLNFQDCLDDMEVELLENHLDFKKIPDAGFENKNWNILRQRNFNYHLVD